MRINITGIRKLTDGTVTGSFTTDKENYLPLVIMDNDGKEIHLTTEKQEETTPTFLLVMKDMIQRELRAEYERGLSDAVQGNLLTEGMMSEKEARKEFGEEKGEQG